MRGFLRMVTIEKLKIELDDVYDKAVETRDKANDPESHVYDSRSHHSYWDGYRNAIDWVRAYIKEGASPDYEVFI